MAGGKLVALSCRIDRALFEKVQEASNDAENPYAPSITRIVSRGLVLALAELESMKRKR